MVTPMRSNVSHISPVIVMELVVSQKNDREKLQLLQELFQDSTSDLVLVNLSLLQPHMSIQLRLEQVENY